MRPCPTCTRHVRHGDGNCPFCGGGLARSLAGGKMLAAGLVLAATAGCSVPTPVYGAPEPPTASPSTSPVPPPMPLYGAPAPAERPQQMP